MLLTEAIGHDAKIFQFSEGVIMMPLTTRETMILNFALRKIYEVLKRSGDFPEKVEYYNLICNLINAEFISKERR